MHGLPDFITHGEVDLRSAQEAREDAARDAARGQRLATLRAGNADPVVKRWINGSIVPISALLGEVAACYLSGQIERVAVLLDMPTIELAEDRNPIKPLLQWCQRKPMQDASPYADDLVLTFMATAVAACLKMEASLIPDKGKLPQTGFNSFMGTVAKNLRECAAGQCISHVQGATAMRAIRERYPQAWKQSNKLERIAITLNSQVRPEVLRRLEASEDHTKLTGQERVINITDPEGRPRMLTLKRTPDKLDWTMLAMTYRPDDDAASDPHLAKWLGLAQMIFACAQKAGDWFELVSLRNRGDKHPRRWLALSADAYAHVMRDAERWASLGFIREPMIFPPDEGDYLTIKHRRVTGSKPAFGRWTEPQGAAWLSASALADTPWNLNHWFSTDLRSQEQTLNMVDLNALGMLRRTPQPFYLPISMDFRGRIYHQCFSPQKGEFAKAALCFPPLAPTGDEGSMHDATIMHLTGLYGLGKQDRNTRVEWWYENKDRHWHDLMAGCDPDHRNTFKAHLYLHANQEDNRIPVQLDGTCNGLQHLSAMFRDEQAAHAVNLLACPSSMPPQDIYGLVAQTLMKDLSSLCPDLWLRMRKAGICTLTRKITKKAVMTLPYGATEWGFKDAMVGVLVDLFPDLDPTSWTSHVNYTAFADRPIEFHPLFRQDSGMLASLIWKAISPVIPKPMAAMETLKEIGRWVGDRVLTWETADGLWPVMAAPVTEDGDVQAKGFHLPNSVRRMYLAKRKNEVSKRKQVSGIVPNFIHSQDATHLRLTLSEFRRHRPQGCVGAVHDCLLVRPDDVSLMGTCLRSAFVGLYESDPLSMRVQLCTKEGLDREFTSWYELADAAGVSFPERGNFNIREVLDSAWFFS